MAYKRLNLKNGDVLTEEHLKHIEDGIEEAGSGGGSGDDESAASAAESAAAAQASAEAAEKAKSDAEGFKDIASRSALAAHDDLNAAKDAKTAAEEAQDKAETAQANAEKAKEDAESAKTAAETAKSSAQSAYQATYGLVADAQRFANQAGNSASAADSAADSAYSFKNAAATSESNAGKSATNAANSATAAQSAKTAAETAQGKAEDAKADAESAKTAAETAKGGADSAKAAAATSETNAAKSATAAANSASAAQTAQGKAESAQTAAETAKSGAESAKTAAATSESNAGKSATNAASSATAASNSAAAAKTSETNAASSASSASSSKTAAANSATTATNAANAAKGYRDEVAEMVASSGIEATAVPDYWLEHLADKASAIQTAMEKAGRHKSAFLWYTDAHWPNGNSKVSPVLLQYLYENTPMNKINFGGDIIGDTLLATRDDMEYLYEWRKAIKGLPNHHSVFGNHDKFDLDTVDYEDENYRYAFLLAPEESPDMVMGDGNYYYIDNPAEKTRYLYFDYIPSGQTAMMAQGQFMVDAIKGVPEGWHIVAINHRWWQYSKSSTPTTGSIPPFETDMLSVFDAYNARATRSGSNYFYAQDFTEAKGKVEFCIGGHIHVDYDMESPGGIPIIITTSDTNQNRVPDSTVDSGTTGTITEAAVFGIVADYTDAANPKINVIGVGRGTSRVVRTSGIKPVSISGITYSGDTTVGATIDKSKFSFTVEYSNGATDTISGATSVSPATIGVVGDNAVTITYTEGAVTLSGTVSIVGTDVPVVNLLNLDRTYEAGTSGASMGVSNLDESKAYTNISYSNLSFAAKACTVADISEDGVTITEPGTGGIVVTYPVHLSDIDTQDYKLSFDYTGTGKTRVYYKFGKAGGTFSANLTALDASGSSHADLTIQSANHAIGTGFEWLIISIGANTGKTTTVSNVSLTKA